MPEVAICYEEFGHDWIPEKGEFVPSHSVELFDGKLLKYFYGKGRFDHPHVTIEENPKGPLVGRSTWADPIKMIFRPFSLASRTFDPKNLVLTNETEMFDNNRVLVWAMKTGRYGSIQPRTICRYDGLQPQAITEQRSPINETRSSAGYHIRGR